MSTILIKLGGSILHDACSLMDALCAELKILQQMGNQIVIVHGGSKAIQEALAIYQIPSEFIAGLRVTSTEAMKVIEMVLVGNMNAFICKKLSLAGIPAFSFSGANQQLFCCESYSEQHGSTGKITAVNNASILHAWSFPGAMPVIAPVGMDAAGNSWNINADTAACLLAENLAVEQLIFLTDQEGIYDQNGNALRHLSKQDLQQCVNNKIVKEGMLVKVNAILDVIHAQFKKILILNGKRENILIDTLVHSHISGTECAL